jgi:hypothetical protein
MGAAARLVDRLAHRHAAGRWLATGGGGYDAYRVVPRAWALTWLAGAHRDAPAAIPESWRERWAADAARYGQAPLPDRFDDVPDVGAAQRAAEGAGSDGSRRTIGLVRRLVIPRLLREAVDRGWWSPEASVEPTDSGLAGRGEVVALGYRPAVIDRVDAALWSRMSLAPRVIPPVATEDSHALVLAALRDGARVTAAVDETMVVGVLLSRWSNEGQTNELLALGVAPAARRAGLAGRLVEAHLGLLRPGEDGLRAEIAIGERDPFEPLDPAVRARITHELLERAGCTVRAAGGELAAADPHAVFATRR